MKLVIASDIHGSAYWCGKLMEVIEAEQPDRIILLDKGTVLGSDVPREICRQQLLEQTMGVSLCCTDTGYSYRYL